MQSKLKSKLKRKPSIGTFLAVPAALLACASAHGQLLSSETFTGYTPGNLLDSGTSPTVAGYTGNWGHAATSYGTGDVLVNSGSLNYSGSGYANGFGNSVGVPQHGGSGDTTQGYSGRVDRSLDASLTVGSSTTGTLYLSWLFQDGFESTGTLYQMLSLYSGSPDQDKNIAFDAGLTKNGGQSGNVYDFGVNSGIGSSTPTYANLGVNADSGVHLFVAEFNLSAAANGDSMTIWLDPNLGSPGAGTTTSGLNLQWDSLALSDYSGNSASWDDIRWGTTLASVTTAPVPAPEPSTIAVASLGGLAMLFLRKRMRA